MITGGHVVLFASDARPRGPSSALTRVQGAWGGRSASLTAHAPESAPGLTAMLKVDSRR